jgi:hypothetical protein
VVIGGGFKRAVQIPRPAVAFRPASIHPVGRPVTRGVEQLLLPGRQTEQTVELVFYVDIVAALLTAFAAAAVVVEAVVIGVSKLEPAAE